MKISILRALHHLSRLKVLVEEPREKHREEEEEKDEDEGRYSSSSAEGLVCTQQKSSWSERPFYQSEGLPVSVVTVLFSVFRYVQQKRETVQMNLDENLFLRFKKSAISKHYYNSETKPDYLWNVWNVCWSYMEPYSWEDFDHSLFCWFKFWKLTVG